MNLLQGAEALVEVSDSVRKRRVEKGYRHPELDSRLRVERTSDEVRLLKRAAKYGVRVPEVLEASEDEFEMELIRGEQLAEKLPDEKAMENFGREVAKLHEAGIIHGDLNTRNVIVDEGESFLIDFGLSFDSEKVEDRAVDINLLRQVLESSHPSSSEESWRFFMKGYSESESSGKVEKRLEEVAQRGRYK